MTMRRGKLQWSGAELNVMCDQCGRSRTVGDHSACSAARKKSHQLDAFYAVKAQLIELKTEREDHEH